MSRRELTESVALEPARQPMAVLQDWRHRAWLTCCRRWTGARDRRRLMELPDEMLRDIGLSRSEIEAAVRWGNRP
jgi:uncharacterized protein YjiS (DUF1127 family)